MLCLVKIRGVTELKPCERHHNAQCFKIRRVKIQLDTALNVIRYAYVFVFVHVVQVVVRATLERHVFFCLNILYGCDDSNGNAHMPDWCVIHLRCRSAGEGTIFYSICR